VSNSASIEIGTLNVVNQIRSMSAAFSMHVSLVYGGSAYWVALYTFPLPTEI